MQHFRHATIKVDDDPYGLSTDNGQVVITAESPHATVTLAEWSKTERRFVRRDRLTECEVKLSAQGGATIIGTSEMLAREVKTPDAKLTVRVGPPKKCRTC